MIGLAGLLNLYLGGGLPGALAFGLGLLSVCALQLDLFTGKIRAKIDGKISLKQLGIVLMGNIVGILFICCYCLFLPARETIMQNAANIMAARSNLMVGTVCIRGILCGICVQLAVDMWGKSKKEGTTHPFMAMLPATAFVLLGCNHCIADTLYLVLGGAWGQIFQIFEAICGNVIGAFLFSAANQDR